MTMWCDLFSVVVFLLAPPSQGFAVGHGRTSTVVSYSSTKMSAASASEPSSSSDLAVVGCGVLGTSLCRQLLESPEFGSRSVTAVTRTDARHDEIASAVGSSVADRLILTTSDAVRDSSAKFRDVVFCAPPSGFDDYAGAVKEAVTNVWEGPSGGGTFVFTSSGAVYQGSSSETAVVVTESSPLARDVPRAARLIGAEEACLERGGTVLRLAGLYTLERGPHNYWLEKLGENGGGVVKGRENGVLNMLHYDDAANACAAAVLNRPDTDGKPRVFLISDGNPTTRRKTCEDALRSARYAGKSMPTFSGSERDDLGKTYDGTWSNEVLKWKPKFAASFEEFMRSHGS